MTMSEDIKATPVAAPDASQSIDTDALLAEVSKKATKAATKAASKTDIKRSQIASALERLVEPTKREKRAAELASAEDRGANGVLKDLGVKKAERARMMEEIKAGKVALNARQQEADLLRREATEAKAAVDKANPYVERMKQFADAEYEALPESFQKALTDMSIEDPLERLKMIDIWKKNGVMQGTTASAGTGAKSVAKSATTMGASGPAAPKSGPAMTHEEVWRSLRDRGSRFEAAQYYQTYGNQIFPKQQT